MNADKTSGWDERVERLHRGQVAPGDAEALRAAGRSTGQGEWVEDELALDAALGALPRPAVSSNFTQRVLDAVALEERRAERAGTVGSGWWRRLWPRLVGVGAALGAVTLALMLQSRAVERARLARDVVAVVQAAEAPRAANLPAVETLQDFEAIQLSAPEVRVDFVGLVSALSEQ